MPNIRMQDIGIRINNVRIFEINHINNRKVVVIIVTEYFAFEYFYHILIKLL